MVFEVSFKSFSYKFYTKNGHLANIVIEHLDLFTNILQRGCVGADKPLSSYMMSFYDVPA